MFLFMKKIILLGDVAAVGFAITTILIIIGLVTGIILLPIIDVIVCGLILAIIYAVHKRIKEQNNDKGDSQ